VVEAAAGALAVAGGEFVEARDSVAAHGRATTAEWTGLASMMALSRSEVYAAKLFVGADACRAAEPVLRVFAAELRAAQQQYADAQARLAAGQAQIDGVGSGASAAADAARAQGQAVVAEAAGAMDAALLRVQRANEVAAGQIDGIVGELAGMRTTPPNGGGSAPLSNFGLLGLGAFTGLSPTASPTGKSCAETLACTIDDFNSMSIDERRAFVAEFQRLYGARLYVEGKWNNIDGVLQFFSEDNLGRPGTWESWVDSSILHGFERGAAIALGRPGGDQGNPGADRWFLYFQTMLFTRGGIPKAEQDKLWSEGEQASTEHGYRVAAEHGSSPGLPELAFAGGGEVYRWILRHEGQIDEGLETVGRANPFLWPLTQLGREALGDFTDPANRYPSYLGGHIMHGGGQVLEGGGEMVGGFVRRDPRMLGEGVIDTGKGGAEVIRYGGEAVVRGAGWLWNNPFD